MFNLYFSMVWKNHDSCSKVVVLLCFNVSLGTIKFEIFPNTTNIICSCQCDTHCGDVWAYRGILTEVWLTIQGILTEVWLTIQGILTEVWLTIQVILTEVWLTIQVILTGAFWYNTFWHCSDIKKIEELHVLGWNCIQTLTGGWVCILTVPRLSQIPWYAHWGGGGGGIPIVPLTTWVQNSYN